MIETAPPGERGTVLPVVMLVLLCLLAAGLSVALVGSAEVSLAAAEQERIAAGYVAQAFLERAMADLRWAADWNRILDGSECSGLADGPPGGTRQLPAAEVSVDLDAIRHQANCGHRAPCTEGEMNAVTAERPWGLNNPRWRLFAYGPAPALLPAGRVVAPFYGVVLAGDDGAEVDGLPEVDGTAGSAGSGVLWLRAVVVGAAGSRTVIEAAVERPRDPGGPVVPGRLLRLRSWTRRPTLPGGF